MNEIGAFYHGEIWCWNRANFVMMTLSSFTQILVHYICCSIPFIYGQFSSNCAYLSQTSMFLHLQWNLDDIYQISRVRTSQSWRFFKKISVTKLIKIGSIPTSSFTMKICTDFNHIQVSYRNRADLSTDVFRLFVWGLAAEIWQEINQTTARNFTASGDGGGTHLVPVICERMLNSRTRTPESENAYKTKSKKPGHKTQRHIP